MSLTTSLVSYWKLDEASGTRFDSQSSNDLTDNNTVGSATGIINNAGDFESSNSEYLSHAINSGLAPGNQDFTFQAWVNLESAATLVVLAIDGDTEGQYVIYYAVGSGFSFRLYNPGASVSHTVSDSGTIGASLGVWYHLIAWYDDANKEIGIAVNSGSATTVSTAGDTVAIPTVVEFRIGAREVTGSQLYFDGLIDDVGLWHRVLTSGERTALYNSGAGLAYPFGGTAAISGTTTASITEADIVAGGKTIVITLTGDTWVASGSTFNAIRQDILDGLDSDQSETHGWNAEVRDSEVVSAVVRTSATVVTITLSAAAAYNITAQETITVTVPAAALTGAVALAATPTFTVDFVPGPTREHFYVESLGTSTTSSLSYVNKATLTFTPTASADYWIFASARVAADTIGIATGSRLRDVTASATLRENFFAPRRTVDHNIQFSLDKFTSGSSPVPQQFDIDYSWGALSGNAEISKTTLLVLKASPADQYAESEGDSDSTTTTLADKVTLTFTGSGDYLIIATANIVRVTNEVIRVVLDQDGSATFGDCGHMPRVGDVKAWATMVKLTLSGSHTFKIQFSRVSGSSQARIRNAAILALRLDRFTGVQYAEARARTTTTSGSYQDKATLTFTPTAAPHIVIGGGLSDIASATDNIFWTLDKDGTSQVEHSSGSNTLTSPELNYCPAELWLQKQTLSEVSTTWKTRYHSENSSTAGFAESAIAVFDLSFLEEPTEPPIEGESSQGGSVTFEKKRKKRPRVIRFSDYSTREAYAAALAQSAIPMTQVREDGSVSPEDDFEDDDDILFAIVKLLH